MGVGAYVQGTHRLVVNKWWLGELERGLDSRARPEYGVSGMMPPPGLE